MKFDDARFQVTEVLEQNYRRQDAMKAQLQRYKHAVEHWRTTSFRDVIAPQGNRPESSSMAYDEVYHQVCNALAEKAFRYKPPACAQLDALVDFHLHGVSTDLASPLPDDAALRQQGWRSVSFTMAMCSHVVYATDAAPAFLQTSVGQTRRYLGDPYAFYQL